MTDPRDERIAELEDAIERIMIGGNHLASALIGLLGAGEKTFPPYSCAYLEARRIIANRDHYDAWVCWRTIMQARDSLTPTVFADDPIAFFVGGGFWRTSRLRRVAPEETQEKQL